MNHLRMSCLYNSLVRKFIYLKTIFTKSGIKKKLAKFSCNSPAPPYFYWQHFPPSLSQELQPKQREASNHALRESRFFLSPLPQFSLNIFQMLARTARESKFTRDFRDFSTNFPPVRNRVVRHGSAAQGSVQLSGVGWSVSGDF